MTSLKLAVASPSALSVVLGEPCSHIVVVVENTSTVSVLLSTF